MAQQSVGVVADSATAMVQLRTLVNELGHTVTYALTAEQALTSSPLYPMLWIVVSEKADDVFSVLSEWSDVPIFLGDDLPPEDDRVFYQQWRESLGYKIVQTLDDAPDGHLRLRTELPTSTPPDAYEQPDFEEVWVLAASLGGPEAVREFLKAIHPDLPVAMIYAQHIEPNFDKMLPIVLGKNSNFELMFSTEGEVLKKGRVVVIPSHTLAKVDKQDRLNVLEGEEWDKPYTPNIDQVIHNVADIYHGRMGTIIFSGMCDDGAEASLHWQEKGMPLWAQIPVECICAGMPESVINSGRVDFIGTAVELAEKLNGRYGFVEDDEDAEDSETDNDELDADNNVESDVESDAESNAEQEAESNTEVEPDQAASDAEANDALDNNDTADGDNSDRRQHNEQQSDQQQEGDM